MQINVHFIRSGCSRNDKVFHELLPSESRGLHDVPRESALVLS